MLDINNWAIVLAGGEGSRLHSLTTDASGIAVPKQYCSLFGGASLLQEAVARATAVAPLARVVVVVASEHRRWWFPQLADLPAQNLIVQPENRGTAHGVLLPLLQIAVRDPDARATLLPADHFLRDERILALSLRRAAELSHVHPNDVYLLGVQPDEADTELGYIVPTERVADGPVPVSRFTEKPQLAEAQDLRRKGALWNVFIASGAVAALLKLFGPSFAQTRARMESLLADGHGSTLDVAWREFYAGLPTIDFSKGVLQEHAAALQVLAVPACGWTDLGTPRRVEQTLARHTASPVAPGPRHASHAALNLSERVAVAHGVASVRC
jgi:mannose-1-phosphate guanylyltransferase